MTTVIGLLAINIIRIGVIFQLQKFVIIGHIVINLKEISIIDIFHHNPNIMLLLVLALGLVDGGHILIISIMNPEMNISKE